MSSLFFRWKHPKFSGTQKGPAERGHVKTSKIVKKCQEYFRHFSTFFEQGKKRQKSSKSVKKFFDTFWQFSRGPRFPAPFGGLWQIKKSNPFSATDSRIGLFLVWFVFGLVCRPFFSLVCRNHSRSNTLKRPFCLRRPQDRRYLGGAHILGFSMSLYSYGEVWRQACVPGLKAMSFILQVSRRQRVAKLLRNCENDPPGIIFG